MVWPSRFLAVPTGYLRPDGSIRASAKASPGQIRDYMASLPAVYQQLCDGAGPAQFEAMRSSPDPQLRSVGDAYYHLFSQAGIDHRIEADYLTGSELVVTRGRHRVEAAKQLGLPYLPVHVRAPDDRTMDAIADRYDAEVAANAPRVVEAQRRLEAEQSGRQTEQPYRLSRTMTRESTRGPDSPDRSRSNPGRANR
jgi:hypothetical protein